MHGGMPYAAGLPDAEDRAPAPYGVALPIHPASVYAFPDLESTLAGFEGRPPGHLYSRFDHPTGIAVEARIAAVAGSERALLFSSGMAAIALAAMTYCRDGGHLLASTDLYGGTATLLRAILPGLGIRVEQIPVDAFGDAGRYVRPDTRMILVESPTNPLLRLIDFDALFASLPAPRPVVMLDATFATPIGHRAGVERFDLVLHSATKYLGGHDDLLAGAITGSAARLAPIYETRKFVGATCDPNTAWLIERGLKTMALRYERQCANALELARRLEAHPRVERVHYPGLPSHPHHELARRQMTAFGGVLAFEVRGGQAAAVRAFDALRLVLRAPSLGGVESAVLHPATSSHRGLSAKEREAIGIGDGLLRLSVGIETVDDLWRDLTQALG